MERELIVQLNRVVSLLYAVGGIILFFKVVFQLRDGELQRRAVIDGAQVLTTFAALFYVLWIVLELLGIPVLMPLEIGMIIIVGTILSPVLGFFRLFFYR